MSIKVFSASLMAITLAIGTAGCQIQHSEIKQNVSADSLKIDHSTVKSKIRDYLQANHINGSIAVIKNGNILFNDGIGFANFNKRSLNQADTTFPIASITKSIMAVCILQLEEKGTLSLNDPVSRYIPDFPNGKQIQLVHLLNHTSGVKAPFILKQNPKPAEIIKKITEDEIKFPAGTKWDYNDINYTILGFIVEKVAKMPLHDYIQKNIFDKAKMNHSGFMTIKNPVPYHSAGYIRSGNQLLPAKPLNVSLLFGCGDLYSTAMDVCLFDQALMAGKLISKQSVKKMLTPGPKSSYGLGVYNKGDHFYSRGVLSGWESVHACYQDQTVIAILLNVRDRKIDIHKLANALHQIAAGSSNPGK